jgi:hypothetical protein
MSPEKLDAVTTELKKLAQELNLSDSQKAQLKTSLEEKQAKLQEFRQKNPNISRKDLIQKIVAIRSTLREQVVQFLTPLQLEKWMRRLQKLRNSWAKASRPSCLQDGAPRRRIFQFFQIKERTCGRWATTEIIAHTAFPGVDDSRAGWTGKCVDRDAFDGVPAPILWWPVSFSIRRSTAGPHPFRTHSCRLAHRRVREPAGGQAGCPLKVHEPEEFKRIRTLHNRKSQSSFRVDFCGARP